MEKVYTYATAFMLTNPVVDFEAAKNFLKREKMINYLKNDKRLLKYGFKDEDIEALVNVEWNLYSDNKGEIVLTTSKLLTNDQLDGVSDWISGQNSDGLGESFEQQDFASYQEDYDYCDDDDEFSEDDFWVCASFDWQSNPYKLELLS